MREVGVGVVDLHIRVEVWAGTGVIGDEVVENGEEDGEIKRDGGLFTIECERGKDFEE